MAPGASKCLHEPQPLSPTKEVVGYWGSRLKVKQEPEVITVAVPLQGQNGKAFPPSRHLRNGKKSENVSHEVDDNHQPTCDANIPRPLQCSENSWEDQLLRKLNGKNGNFRKILWRPGSGRHIDEGPDSYKPFTHIVRTLHLEEALQVIAKNRMEPKSVVTFSCLDSSFLPPEHPCANLKILWFSAKFADEDDEDPNWYGNVEFAVSCDLLLELFKFCFLVEIMTTPTHTTSRLLLTNTDYSPVLPQYHWDRAGGPWQVLPEGHKTLVSCSRYKFKGENLFNHVLEFMLEVNQEDEHKLLSKCKISFKNHENARDISTPHVCNRSQRMKTPCPSPLTREETARIFFERVQQLPVNRKKLASKLTESATACLPGTL